MGEKRGMRALEAWCRRVTDGYRGVRVDNMSTSWRDGLAFCALIHHFRPDLIDFDSLDKADVYRNNELAFRVAERHLGIPALLDAEDMVEYEVPDRLSILTYLSQFYQAFGGSTQPGVSPSRTVAKRSANNTDLVNVSESPPAKVPAHLPAGVLPVKRREPCAVCGLPVFLAERLLVGGHLYHRSCFRCARCNNPLSLANCYETEDGHYCCETCPDEVLEEKRTLAVVPEISDTYSANFESALENTFSSNKQIEFSDLSRASVARSSFMSSLMNPEESFSETDSDALSRASSSKELGQLEISQKGVVDSKSNEPDSNLKNTDAHNSTLSFKDVEVKPKNLDDIKSSVGTDIVSGSLKEQDVKLNLNIDRIRYNNVKELVDKNVDLPLITSCVNENISSDSQPVTANIILSEEHRDDNFDKQSTKDTDLLPKSLVKMRLKMFENSDNSIASSSIDKTLKTDTNRRLSSDITASKGSFNSEDKIDIERKAANNDSRKPSVSENKSAIEDTSLNISSGLLASRAMFDNEMDQSLRLSDSSIKDEMSVTPVPLVEDSTPSIIKDNVTSNVEESFPSRVDDSVPSRVDDSVPSRVDDSVPSRADDSVPSRADDSVPSRADDSVPSRADDTVPSRADDTVPSRADDTVPSRADDTVPSRADDTVPSRADDTVPSRADDTVPSRADDTVPSRADDTVPSRADDTVPSRADDSVPSRVDDSVPSRVDDSVPSRVDDPVTSRIDDPVSLRVDDSVSSRVDDSVPSKMEDSVPSKMEDSVPSKMEDSVPSRDGDFISKVEELLLSKLKDTNENPVTVVYENKCSEPMQESGGDKFLPSGESGEPYQIPNKTNAIINEEDYPEDLNPFGDEGDEVPDVSVPSDQSTLPKPESTNPFGSSDDEEEETTVAHKDPRSSSDTASIRKHSADGKPPRPPLPVIHQKEETTRKIIQAPKVTLNPFWSDGEEPSDDEDVVLRDDKPSNKTPVPRPRTIRPAVSTPEPTPRRTTLSAYPSGNFGSASSLSSLSSSAGGSTARRKKKPAPLPPSMRELFPDSQQPVPSETSSRTSSPTLSVKGLSPVTSPRHKKKSRPAPPPPSLPVGSSVPTSEVVHQEKMEKDVANRNRQSQNIIPLDSPGSPKSSVTSDCLPPSPPEAPVALIAVPNKSIHGQWKRKKGPAPPRPIPQRRQIKAIPMQEVRRELEDIEVKQQELERQGVKLEQTIRFKFEQTESEDSSMTPDVEDLVLQLFELVNEKNELFRRQAELMYLRRQQRLEEEHADLEYQIRCLLERPDYSKTDNDKAREEELIQRLVEVVERRNEIVECLEMDRLREAEEDHSIHTQLGLFAAKNRGNDENKEEKKSKHPFEKMKLKKDKKSKKQKDKVGHKKANKIIIDADKDIDESENPIEHSKEKEKKSKKKWFL